MVSLPIVERELRVAARRWGTYWIRAAMAAFGVLACLHWFAGGVTLINPATIGQGAFHMLSLLGLVMALGSPVITADCISHERREGTLGLLFLTSLKSHDVVLGKFAATGLLALYVLLGFAPVMLLPMMFGGVTGGEAARMAIILLNTLFLSLATGLFVSTRARTQYGAILGSFGALAAIGVGPFLIEVLLPARLYLPFSLVSPIYSFQNSGETLYLVFRSGFWASVIITHIVGWTLVLLAVFTLRHNWRVNFVSRALKASKPQARRLLAPARVLVLDRENRRRAFAPVARAMLRMRGQRAMAWFAAGIALLGSLWNVFVMNQIGSVWAAASVSQVFTLASSALFAFIAGRFLFESRRSGELELLLVTPVGARGILREQRLALMRLLVGPMYLVVIGSILAAAGNVHFTPDYGLIGLFFGVCNLLSSVIGVLAVCRVGMWFGTRANNLFALIGGTVGLVMILPIALVYLLPLFLLKVTSNPAFGLLAVAPVLLLKNFFFLAWATNKLRREFRTRERTVTDRILSWIHASAAARLPEQETQSAQ